MTDEDPALVEEWLARAKPAYPIAIAGGRFEDFLKVQFFPYCGVIGPDGVVAYAGSVGMKEGPLGEALEKTEKGELWPKSLSKVTKLMVGDPIDAYGELKEMLAKGKVEEADRPTVDEFVAYLEEQAASKLEHARKRREAGYVFEAVQAIEAYAGSKTAFPVTDDCKALIAELEALPDYKKELKGGEDVLDAQALEKQGEYLEAFELFRKVAKKYDGTKIGANALADARRLMEDGMPGYQKACGSCREGRRACAKHAEKVKL